MANILQVTTPSLNTDNRNILNPQDPRQAGQAVHNPVDPTRVVRADGKDGEQTGANTQDALLSVLDYDSNYGAFVKGLGENGNLSAVMERLLFGDMAGLRGAEQAEVSALVERFLMSMRMDSPEDLLQYLQGQGEGILPDRHAAAAAQYPQSGNASAATGALRKKNHYTLSKMPEQPPSGGPRDSVIKASGAY